MKIRFIEFDAAQQTAHNPEGIRVPDAAGWVPFHIEVRDSLVEGCVRVGVWLRKKEETA